jgi:succinate dehydrogenase flavin-adding protein (antitoxin of CptAB toxin-antitoxin module)
MDEVELRRLKWRCRRGTLENDLALERFLTKYADVLDGERLRAFQALLDYPDHHLWEILSGRRRPSDPALIEIVQMFRSCEGP